MEIRFLLIVGFRWRVAARLPIVSSTNKKNYGYSTKLKLFAIHLFKSNQFDLNLLLDGREEGATCWWPDPSNLNKVYPEGAKTCEKGLHCGQGWMTYECIRGIK